MTVILLLLKLGIIGNKINYPHINVFVIGYNGKSNKFKY